MNGDRSSDLRDQIPWRSALGAAVGVGAGAADYATGQFGFLLADVALGERVRRLAASANGVFVTVQTVARPDILVLNPPRARLDGYQVDVQVPSDTASGILWIQGPAVGLPIQ